MPKYLLCWPGGPRKIFHSKRGPSPKSLGAAELIHTKRQLERTPKRPPSACRLHPPKPPFNFTYPPFALSSATFH